MEDNKEHRIKVKVGNAEFVAEGDPDLVKEQFAQFMQIVSSIPQSQQPPVSVSQSDPFADPVVNSGEENQAINSNILDKIFYERDGLISLSAIPDDTTDALILILYGYEKLSDDGKVTGMSLMKSSRQSGVNIERVDKYLNPRKDLVLAGGAKRGRRYSLNNKGTQYAEKLMRELI